MKVTGELKDKVEAVETSEAKKAIIADAGVELSNDELENVAGGKLAQPSRKLAQPTNRLPR